MKISKINNDLSFESIANINIDYNLMFNVELTAQAYPNFSGYVNIPNQRDTTKWLEAMRVVYQAERNGHNRSEVMKSVVNGWPESEVFDFINWVKFYQSGDHMKYKYAQVWYENQNLGPGYFLQVKQDQKQEHKPSVDLAYIKHDVNQETDQKQKIEKQRNKLIGRLDSAEKLLRTTDGALLLGDDLESIFEAIYQLKKKIQLVNKKSFSNKTYEDMIVREGNILLKSGFNKAAELMYSFAQTPAQSGNLIDDTANDNVDFDLGLTAAPPGDPTGAGNPGAPSGGAATIGMPPGDPNMPLSEKNDPPRSKGINDFLTRLNDSIFVHNDTAKSDDVSYVDDLEVFEDNLSATAQAVPPPIEKVAPSAVPEGVANQALDSEQTVEDKNLEVSDEDLEVKDEDLSVSENEERKLQVENIDNKIDEVFSQISVSDVIAKLEDLSKIFKTREVPRQLNIVDMMLNALNLASFFPSLSEASNKALESNNYISSRVEEILSKLRGAEEDTGAINLSGEESDRPDVAGVRDKLESDENKEKARKKKRKELENEAVDIELDDAPDVEIDEDLSAPIKAQETSPEAKPVASPAPPSPQNK